MKHGQGDHAIYTCDFCGMSNKGMASMFISNLDKWSAICKPCVDGLPAVYGKVLACYPPADPPYQLEVGGPEIGKA